LAGSRKKKSADICNVCACMDRFARSPGAGFNDYTSPGQNTCIYADDFEYYFYPIRVQETNSKLKNPPPITIGKYVIINSNIIQAKTEADLNVANLYTLLTTNGITKFNAYYFITDVLYQNDDIRKRELDTFLKTGINVDTIDNKSSSTKTKESFGSTYDYELSSNTKMFLLVLLIVILIYFCVSK
jgi:hypothetical protein